MLRFMTAGESHGPALNVILEGIPAGMELDFDAVDHELARRQKGYGRGARMKIEQDRVEVLGGLRSAQTTGGPISFLIHNKDWKNWKDKLSPYEKPTGASAELVNPRPGHADLAGALKYGVDDFRNILERASARETAARVAAGAVAKQFLRHLDCEIRSHVVGVGSVQIPNDAPQVAWEEIVAISEDAHPQLRRCGARKENGRRSRSRDPGKGHRGRRHRDRRAYSPAGSGLLHPVGPKARRALGASHFVHPRDEGHGLRTRRRFRFYPRVGPLHDEIFYSPAEGLHRGSNNAGGLEGGVTNGQELRIKAYMKPLSSLRKPLRSVDIRTMKPIEAARVRSDICAVPAAGVVGEAMVALTLADAALEKFGGDSLAETLANYEAHSQRIKQILKERETANR